MPSRQSSRVPDGAPASGDPRQGPFYYPPAGGSVSSRLLDLAVADIRRRGCAAAGVRLAGRSVTSICRLDLYAAWRLLACFESPHRCILLLVAEHTRTGNLYRLLYEILDIPEPDAPRTKLLRPRRPAAPRHGGNNDH